MEATLRYNYKSFGLSFLQIQSKAPKRNLLCEAIVTINQGSLPPLFAEMLWSFCSAES